MGFKATITKNGMTGELYFIIVHANDRKIQGISDVRLRSFESREKLIEAKAVNNQGYDGGPITQYITDEEFQIPLDSDKNLTTEDAYSWIKANHYPDAIDVIE